MLELLHGAPKHDALQLVRQTRVGSCPRQTAGNTEWVRQCAVIYVVACVGRLQAAAAWSRSLAGTGECSAVK